MKKIPMLEKFAAQSLVEHHGELIFSKEKFAELIVEECLKELRYTVVDTQECRQDKSQDYQVGWEDGMYDAGEAIKEHFGVE